MTDDTAFSLVRGGLVKNGTRLLAKRPGFPRASGAIEIHLRNVRVKATRIISADWKTERTPTVTHAGSVVKLRARLNPAPRLFSVVIDHAS